MQALFLQSHSTCFRRQAEIKPAQCYIKLVFYLTLATVFPTCTPGSGISTPTTLRNALPGNRDSIPSKGMINSLLQSEQTDTGTRQATASMGKTGSFSRCKVDGV